nr:hypothetical protein RSP673_07045 [Ralstonia solanacearum P673]
MKVERKQEAKRGKMAPRQLASDAFAHLGRLSASQWAEVQQVCAECANQSRSIGAEYTKEYLRLAAVRNQRG